MQMIRFLAVLNLILRTHPINTNLPEITSAGFHLVDRATSLHGPTPQGTSINPTGHTGKSHLCHPWTGKCLSQVFRCSQRFPVLLSMGQEPSVSPDLLPLGCAASPHSSPHTVGGPPAPPHGRFPLITPGSQRSPQGQRGDMYQPAPTCCTPEVAVFRASDSLIFNNLAAACKQRV